MYNLVCLNNCLKNHLLLLILLALLVTGFLLLFVCLFVHLFLFDNSAADQSAVFKYMGGASSVFLPGHISENLQYFFAMYLPILNEDCASSIQRNT